MVSPEATRLVCRSRTLDLSEPLVMGVLNVTPDSFSDGGRNFRPDAAVAHALAMVEQGAAIIDVGGESTRPGAAPIASEEEHRRVLPVIEQLARVARVAVSIDTSDPSLMTSAVTAGAELINDVRALRRDGALEAAARSGAGICLMHMQGEPESMQKDPRYGDVVAEVRDFLRERLAACAAAGVAAERLCIDPGIGFGKTHEHNLRLLAELEQLETLGRPILVGVSRKSVVGIITGRPLGDRVAGSSALAALAIERGARIIRAHDVAATVDAVRIAEALRRAAGSGQR
jgi:dihydropteroate synthase